MSRQHASVSQGRICSDSFACCHTEIKVADQTFYLAQSQYTDTGPTSPSADHITPGAWQGSHWSPNFWVTSMTRSGKIPSRAGSSTLGAVSLTTRPSRQLDEQAAFFLTSYIWNYVTSCVRLTSRHVKTYHWTSDRTSFPTNLFSHLPYQKTPLISFNISSMAFILPEDHNISGKQTIQGSFSFIFLMCWNSSSWI